jgi:hypothetical protein
LGAIGNYCAVLIAIRNVLIIMLLALLLTIAPGGGNFVTALFTALTLIFVGAMGLLLIRFWGESALTRDSMTDNQRLTFYGAIGAIALMVAGIDELWGSGPGLLLWLVVVGGSGYLIFTTWRAANSY